jgi:hypothetical protein
LSPNNPKPDQQPQGEQASQPQAAPQAQPASTPGATTQAVQAQNAQSTAQQQPQLAAAPATSPPEEPEDAKTEPQKPAPTALSQKRSRSSLPLVITIATILFLAIVCGVTYAYCKSTHKSSYSASTAKTSNTSWNQSQTNAAQTYPYCTPVSANSLTESTAITAYENFVKAVQTKNQSCANSLSSTYFINGSKDKFGATNGNWITAQPDGVRPIWEDFSQLPASLENGSFTQSTYTEATIAGQSTTTTGPTSGTTLDYPVDLSKYTDSTNQKWEISLSFVLDNGKVLIDDLLVQPQQ